MEQVIDITVPLCRSQEKEEGLEAGNNSDMRIIPVTDIVYSMDVYCPICRQPESRVK